MAAIRNVGDISKYNVIRNYAPLKNHFDGMIIRVGYRGYSAGVIKEDLLFKEHMKGIIGEGMPYGFYFMGQAVTESEAIAEAEFCYEMTKGYSPSFPTYYDSELSNQKGDGRADNLSRRLRTDITKAFCRRMEELGRRAGVYASKSWFETRLYAAELEKYSIWVAQYNTSCGYKETGYDMWQHTSSYKVPGLNTTFDKSYRYKEFSAVTEGGTADTLLLLDGIHSYSLKESGSKQIVAGGVRSNFLLREFRCKDGSDEIILDYGLVEILQKVRSHFGKAVSITSAYRTPSHNKSVGGATSSYHVKGQAADFTVTGVSNRDVAKYLQDIGAKGIGLYDYTGGFVHVDTREKKYFWQQDSRNSKYYSVSTFYVMVYTVKGQTVATVRYNDRNEYVQLLQQELGLNPDGIFGAKTEEAVRVFQQTHGLTADGIAGPKTWSALL
ncbi:MAG: DUF882 domain-containing protein [Clostridia bacterium]|nr:DUF882 domain-containing protein [Clostridia bacterium]